MPWLTSSIVANCFLPTKEISLVYDDSKFLFSPETHELYATVSIEFKSFRIKDYHKTTHEKLKKFLSIFCYVHDCAITELSWYSGPEPMKIGKTYTKCVNESFRLKELPIVTDEKLHLALALFREARSLNSPFYKFFGFHKILNIELDNGNNQKKWINDNLEFLRNPQAKVRLSELKKENSNIGKYLYEC